MSTAFLFVIQNLSSALSVFLPIFVLSANTEYLWHRVFVFSAIEKIMENGVFISVNKWMVGWMDGLPNAKVAMAQ